MDAKSVPDPNDDLEELLDSALSDFQNLNLIPDIKRTALNDEENERESASTSLDTGVQGLGRGMGLPDLKSKNSRKKASNDASKGKVAKESYVVEALDKLREQTRKTVRGLESATSAEPENFESDAMLDDWVKQFEELAGSQDMESIVETMMQQLLSKEILHEPMKEIGERYPGWLEEHKQTLTKEDYDRYSRQYTLIKDLNDVYENDPNNYLKIVDLMQKMQECGQPPNDIVRELAPDLDLSTFGQLSPEILGSQPNCCIM